MQREEISSLFNGILALVLLLSTHECLRLTEVRVPPFKLKGETVVLECIYQLEGQEKLYTAKWYRENEEFYRYVPKYRPPQISYRVEGIRVDHDQSNDSRVTLKSVNLRTTANYRCEISAEAPSFASVQGTSRLEVIVVPNTAPVITGGRHTYTDGDEIDFNCTSGKSYPASELHWLINDKEVTNPDYLQVLPQIVHTHGLITTALRLRLPVSPGYFREGSMKLRCVTNMPPVLRQGRVLEADIVKEALVLVRSEANLPALRPAAVLILFLHSAIT